MSIIQKRFNIYSVTILLLFLAIFTLTNISWKSPVLKNKQVSILDTTLQRTSVDTVLTYQNFLQATYQKINLKAAGLSETVFEKAFTGFLNMQLANLLNRDKNILTVIDFDLPSTSKRMWIIDIKNQKLLLHSYVAHGRGSGDDKAVRFSNQAESHQSSLGFYVANETYFGKHGLSLKLDGLDKGINDLARARAIVVHGADYVSTDFIHKHGRLGRSHGCPAVPQELNQQVINLIKGKTCLFINAEAPNYTSTLLNYQAVVNHFSAQI
nr:murein L,D-transpeptidase catalytic domain family protein [Pedobacter glucosidilyticus]